MAATAFLTEQRTDWRAVAVEVSQRLGRTYPYPAQYIREISNGWRGHKAIVPILVEMGLMELPAALVPASTTKPRRQRAVA